MSENTLTTIQLQQWVDRMQSGDLTARDELLRCVCRRLERLASKMLKDFPHVARWCDTGDVLQNALMRLLHSLQRMQISSTRDFFNLAAVHLRRELLDLARHFTRGDYLAYVSPAPGHDSPDDMMAQFPDQQEAQEELETWRLFHEAVERLPLAEREVISLTFYHGWTQPQIAELLQVDERTVRRRWRSACVKLHETLNGRLPRIEA